MSSLAFMSQLPPRLVHRSPDVRDRVLTPSGREATIVAVRDRANGPEATVEWDDGDCADFLLKLLRRAE